MPVPKLDELPSLESLQALIAAVPELEVDEHCHSETKCVCLSCWREPSVWTFRQALFCDEQPSGDPSCAMQGFTYATAAALAEMRRLFPALVTALAEKGAVR